jgi:hypothetical protein
MSHDLAKMGLVHAKTKNACEVLTAANNLHAYLIRENIIKLRKESVPWLLPLKSEFWVFLPVRRQNFPSWNLRLSKHGKVACAPA